MPRGKKKIPERNSYFSNYTPPGHLVLSNDIHVNRERSINSKKSDSDCFGAYWIDPNGNKRLGIKNDQLNGSSTTSNSPEDTAAARAFVVAVPAMAVQSRHSEKYSHRDEIAVYELPEEVSRYPPQMNSQQWFQSPVHHHIQHSQVMPINEQPPNEMYYNPYVSSTVMNSFASPPPPTANTLERALAVPEQQSATFTNFQSSYSVSFQNSMVTMPIYQNEQFFQVPTNEQIHYQQQQQSSSSFSYGQIPMSHPINNTSSQEFYHQMPIEQNVDQYVGVFNESNEAFEPSTVTLNNSISSELNHCETPHQNNSRNIGQNQFVPDLISSQNEQFPANSINLPTNIAFHSEFNQNDSNFHNIEQDRTEKFDGQSLASISRVIVRKFRMIDEIELPFIITQDQSHFIREILHALTINIEELKIIKFFAASNYGSFFLDVQRDNKQQQYDNIWRFLQTECQFFRKDGDLQIRCREPGFQIIENINNQLQNGSKFLSGVSNHVLQPQILKQSSDNAIYFQQNGDNNVSGLNNQPNVHQPQQNNDNMMQNCVLGVNNTENFVNAQIQQSYPQPVNNYIEDLRLWWANYQFQRNHDNTNNDFVPVVDNQQSVNTELQQTISNNSETEYELDTILTNPHSVSVAEIYQSLFSPAHDIIPVHDNNVKEPNYSGNDAVLSNNIQNNMQRKRSRGKQCIENILEQIAAKKNAEKKSENETEQEELSDDESPFQVSFYQISTENPLTEKLAEEFPQKIQQSDFTNKSPEVLPFVTSEMQDNTTDYGAMTDSRIAVKKSRKRSTENAGISKKKLKSKKVSRKAPKISAKKKTAKNKITEKLRKQSTVKSSPKRSKTANKNIVNKALTSKVISPMNFRSRISSMMPILSVIPEQKTNSLKGKNILDKTKESPAKLKTKVPTTLAKPVLNENDSIIDRIFENMENSKNIAIGTTISKANVDVRKKSVENKTAIVEKNLSVAKTIVERSNVTKQISYPIIVSEKLTTTVNCSTDHYGTQSVEKVTSTNGAKSVKEKEKIETAVVVDSAVSAITKLPGENITSKPVIFQKIPLTNNVVEFGTSSQNTNSSATVLTIKKPSVRVLKRPTVFGSNSSFTAPKKFLADKLKKAPIIVSNSQPLINSSSEIRNESLINLQSSIVGKDISSPKKFLSDKLREAPVSKLQLLSNPSSSEIRRQSLINRPTLNIEKYMSLIKTGEKCTTNCKVKPLSQMGGDHQNLSDPMNSIFTRSDKEKIIEELVVSTCVSSANNDNIENNIFTEAMDNCAPNPVGSTINTILPMSQMDDNNHSFPVPMETDNYSSTILENESRNVTIPVELVPFCVSSGDECHSKKMSNVNISKSAVANDNLFSETVQQCTTNLIGTTTINILPLCEMDDDQHLLASMNSDNIESNESIDVEMETEELEIFTSASNSVEPEKDNMEKVEKENLFEFVEKFVEDEFNFMEHEILVFSQAIGIFVPYKKKGAPVVAKDLFPNPEYKEIYFEDLKNYAKQEIMSKTSSREYFVGIHSLTDFLKLSEKEVVWFELQNDLTFSSFASNDLCQLLTTLFANYIDLEPVHGPMFSQCRYSKFSAMDIKFIVGLFVLCKKPSIFVSYCQSYLQTWFMEIKQQIKKNRVFDKRLVFLSTMDDLDAAIDVVESVFDGEFDTIEKATKENACFDNEFLKNACNSFIQPYIEAVQNFNQKEMDMIVAIGCLVDSIVNAKSIDDVNNFKNRLLSGLKSLQKSVEICSKSYELKPDDYFFWSLLFENLNTGNGGNIENKKITMPLPTWWNDEREFALAETFLVVLLTKLFPNIRIPNGHDGYLYEIGFGNYLVYFGKKVVTYWTSYRHLLCTSKNADFGWNHILMQI